MEATLILNVGNSDMRSPAAEPAVLAAQLVEAPQVDWTTVSFPLLEKYLAYVDLHRLPLRQVFLVGTDQPPTTSAEHRAKDTLPVARLMARWLQETRPGVVARVLPYRGNPTDWDALYAFYNQELPALAGAGKHLVGITGGTQQMNTTLLLAALDHFPDATPLAAAEGRPQPWAVGIARRLKERDLLMAIESHLRHRDFHAALSLLDGEKLLTNRPAYPFCRALLRHADHRCNFRFQEAAQALSDALADAPDAEARETASQLLAEAAALANADLAPGHQGATGDNALRLREMVRLAEQYLDRGLLLELPALVYTFTDVALKLLSDRLGVQFQSTAEEGWPYLDEAWVAAQPGLLDHLESRTARWNQGYNTHVALAVVEWFGQNGNHLAAQVWRELKALEGVRALRHRGPFGHGTVGLADKDLKKAYDAFGRKGATGIIAALREVAGLLAPREADTPFFDLVTTQVLRLLRSR